MKQRGVTLIELMTVMVVLGILAAIAVPSYRAYLLRAQRTEATTALLRVQAAQEKHFLQNNAFTEQLVAAPSAAPPGLGLTVATPSGFYTITVALELGGSGYTATATPTPGGGQRDDALCRSFSINHNGMRTAVDAATVDVTSECWR